MIIIGDRLIIPIDHAVQPGDRTCCHRVRYRNCELACGNVSVKEEFQTPPTPLESPVARAFVSYARKDHQFADALRLALIERNIEVLLDRRDIAPGEPWQD